MSTSSVGLNAGFRLTCRLPHCRFDDDICSTAQAPLAAEEWPSGKQRQANRSITLPLCPPRQIADSWILFNSGAMPLGDKAKAALPLRAATLKQQAMITRHSGKAASNKLVWSQHNTSNVHLWLWSEHNAHFASIFSLCSNNDYMITNLAVLDCVPQNLFFRNQDQITLLVIVHLSFVLPNYRIISPLTLRTVILYLLLRQHWNSSLHKCFC